MAISSLISQIKTLLADSNHTISNVFRQANSVADALAKRAAATQFTTEYSMSTLPRDIKGLVLLDPQETLTFDFLFIVDLPPFVLNELLLSVHC